MKRDRSASELFNEAYNDFSVYRGTRSQDGEILGPYEAKKRKAITWISATKLYNAMMGNHLVDWLNMYGKGLLNRSSSADDEMSKFLCKRGNEFEETIIKHLSTKFNVEKVCNYYTIEAVQETKQHMLNGTQLIVSAPLCNHHTNTYGIADLLVRSDIINDLFEEQVIDTEEQNIKAPKLNGNWHYRVFEIKYCTIPLLSNGKYIQSNPKMTTYKGQLYIYNQALGKLQGYTPSQTYIIGRKTSFTKGGVKDVSKNALERIGVVDYVEHDDLIKDKVKDALYWYRFLQKSGAQWNIDPPSVQELYPNMTIESGKWNNVKADLAKKLGDITMLWHCGEKEKSFAFKHNIYSFYDQECTAIAHGIHKTASTHIDNIILVNRTDKKIISVPTSSTIPQGTEYFVDFETFSDICQPISPSLDAESFGMIFMIGVGWLENGIWQHKTFIADCPTLDAEISLLERFYCFINSKQNPILINWKAESTFWNQALERISSKKNIGEWGQFVWCDLMGIIIKNQIAIKGCYDFGLKNVATSMRQNKMITTTLQAECSNGMIAMIKAWGCYQKYSNPLSAPIMKDIIRYNEYDCKVMCDILAYLRKNKHIM